MLIMDALTASGSATAADTCVNSCHHAQLPSLPAFHLRLRIAKCCDMLLQMLHGGKGGRGRSGSKKAGGPALPPTSTRTATMTIGCRHMHDRGCSKVHRHGVHTGSGSSIQCQQAPWPLQCRGRCGGAFMAGPSGSTPVAHSTMRTQNRSSGLQIMHNVTSGRSFAAAALPLVLCALEPKGEHGAACSLQTSRACNLVGIVAQRRKSAEELLLTTRPKAVARLPVSGAHAFASDRSKTFVPFKCM
jgi:hypothetical protein